MSSTELDIKNLAHAIMYWLSFMTVVGRKYVLNESAIKMPVSEYLAQKGFEDIQLEYSHPSLSKKRFDLYFRSKKNTENAFEFKYVKNGSTRKVDEKQRIFDDLMRLFLFVSSNNSKSYFLICGSKDEFTPDFQNLSNKDQYPSARTKTQLPIKAAGFYTEWFSFDINNPTKNIDLKNQLIEYKDIYDDFISDYQASFYKKNNTNLIMPSNISTNLVFLESDLSINWQPTAIGVWEILDPT
jgi:hypothetical protein